MADLTPWPAGATLPAAAAWRHHDARDGFEVAFFSRGPDGWMIQGATAAVEDGQPWTVRYAILATADWRTRHVEATSLSQGTARTVSLDQDGAGNWSVDGAAAPHLAGCMDVDFESSAVTNALPVHRLDLGLSDRAEAPAAYVRAPDLIVQRLEQRYQRIADGADGQRYEYEAPVFDFRCTLAYDSAGLVTAYPGLATRVR